MEQRALVVEPSRDLRELICEILRAQHFRVDATADASTIANAETYAVVLADIPFGESAGVYANELTARLPSLRKHLVLMSACPEDFDDVGGDMPALLKPFDRKSLLAKVAQVSGR